MLRTDRKRFVSIQNFDLKTFTFNLFWNESSKTEASDLERSLIWHCYKVRERLGRKNLDRLKRTSEAPPRRFSWEGKEARACRGLPWVATEDPQRGRGELDKQTEKDEASMVGAHPHGSRFRADSIDSTLPTVSILGVPWEAYKTWERCREVHTGRTACSGLLSWWSALGVLALGAPLVEGCRLPVRDAICPWLRAGQSKEIGPDPGVGSVYRRIGQNWSTWCLAIMTVVSQHCAEGSPASIVWSLELRESWAVEPAACSNVNVTKTEAQTFQNRS